MASAKETIVELDPSVIYFTFSRIRPVFSCGRPIASTLQQFVEGSLAPHDLPLLTVLTDGTHYYSQNNRRLYLYKQLHARGLLQRVPVRLRPLPSTRRMAHKYTPHKCSLIATLQYEGGGAETSVRAEHASQTEPATSTRADKVTQRGRKGARRVQHEAVPRGQRTLEDELLHLGLDIHCRSRDSSSGSSTGSLDEE